MSSRLKERLEELVGAQFVFDEPGIRATYAADQSFVQGSAPDVVVRPTQAGHVQEIVRIAAREHIPLTPFSSGLNLHGAALPARGGILLDLSSMNSLQINDADWYAIIEPGVTYRDLQNAAADRGLRLMAPWGIPPGRSVLTSYLERDAVLGAAHQEYGNYLIMDTELVLPDGELFRTGCWNVGGRPGGFYGPGMNMLYKLWTGSQGTLGIFTKMIVCLQHLSPVRKFFFLPFEKAQAIPAALRRIQRKEIGLSCFGLNRFNLAALLNDEWALPVRFPAPAVASRKFQKLRDSLPAWTVLIELSGEPYFPEEKIAYEEAELRALCRELSLPIDTGLPGVAGLQELFLAESLRPWGGLKKFNFRGAVHDLSCKMPLARLPELESLILNLAQANSYPAAEVGGYFVVLERGRAIHCEFDLHGDTGDAAARQHARELWLRASRALADGGALFDRPYGAWADLSYGRAPEYARKLRQIKQEMDPAGVLNPGKLCL